MSSRLLAAALLKDDLSDDDKIHGALFSAAFEELDEMRKRLEKIPADVDKSAEGFRDITTRAVDDFVTVANEALSKFIQRTNELKATLASLERTTAPLIARSSVQMQVPMPVPVPAEVPAPSPVSSSASSSRKSRLWVVLPLSVGAGLAAGIAVTFLLMNGAGRPVAAANDSEVSASPGDAAHHVSVVRRRTP